MFRLLGHRRVILVHGDPGVDQAHRQVAVAKEIGDTLQRHSPVDGQGSQVWREE